ncbi:hypothetical protein ABZ749_25080 [Micromonospora sp. NPDC047753]|uniref:hypothetical protein n=1 Tax=Micromonospora sp. NPDC047753 TaxID=3154817 RepID=UPI00340230E9
MTEPPTVPPENTPPTVPQLDVRAAQPPSADTPPPTGGFADRPPGYPSALVWLRAGILRDWRGVLGAFLATWFYLPVALLLAFWGGLTFGVVGLFAVGTGADDQVPQVLRDVPLIGPLVEAFLTRSGGLLGGVAGFAIGFLVGFLAVLALPWMGVADEPFALLTGLIGTVVAAALIGASTRSTGCCSNPACWSSRVRASPAAASTRGCAPCSTTAPDGSACPACPGCSWRTTRS